MSSATHHRAQAELYLTRAQTATPEFAIVHGETAVAHAILAVEARLGELVEAQHTATLLAGQAYGMADPNLARRLVADLAREMKGGASQ